MTLPRAGGLLAQLRKLLGTPPPCCRTDAELVIRFAAERDESAFAALVERHGPMVWRVCRALLGHEQDAEDAFQATFLVLARKANSLRKASSVASWLHGVAARVAAQARRQEVRRRGPPLEDQSVSRQDPPDDLSRAEIQAALHEELSRLAGGDRAPLVLCYLEGKTQNEAAEELGWSKSTLRRRLERGRTRLAARLRRRGLALSAPLLAAALATDAAATVPPGLFRATVLLAASSPAAIGTVPERVMKLAQEASKAMYPSKGKMVAAVLLAVGVLGASAGFAAYRALPAQPPVAASEAEPAPLGKEGRKMDDDAPRDNDLPAKAAAFLRARPLQVVNQTRTLFFSPDGKRMAFVDYDLKRWISRGGRSGCAHTLHLRETASGKELWTAEEAGPFGAGAFSPDSKTLAVSTSETVRSWETATGKERRTLTIKGKMDRRPPNIRALAFSPDGKTLAAVSLETPLVALDLDVSAITPIFTLWELATGKELQHHRGPNGLNYRLVGFASDGKLLAWEEKGLTSLERLVDLRTGKVYFSIGRTQDYVPRAFLSPDRKTCLWPSAGFGDFSLRRWDLTHEKELAALKGHNGSVVAVFSPDAKTVASASADGTVRLWDAATGKELHVLREHTGNVPDIAFSPDGKSLASGGYDGKVFLWETATGKVRDEFRGHHGRIELVYFSPDGKLLVSSGTRNDEGQAREETYLWNLTGRSTNRR
ncbi:MAG TPA: sigma-70 family RNA polymerase sigma factor [Gemmataceae bacterium]|jgi:RNA polymerase sigma factor (sigma-70 family)